MELTSPLTGLERRLDCLALQTGQEHTACGCADFEETADVGETSLSVGSAVGREDYLIAATDKFANIVGIGLVLGRDSVTAVFIKSMSDTVGVAFRHDGESVLAGKHSKSEWTDEVRSDGDDSDVIVVDYAGDGYIGGYVKGAGDG